MEDVRIDLLGLSNRFIRQDPSSNDPIKRTRKDPGNYIFFLPEKSFKSCAL